MAHGLPTSIVIKSPYHESYAYYNTQQPTEGYVTCHESNVFSPFAKIEVETARIDNKYVHLRFAYSNKYWAASVDGSVLWIVARSKEPEEDASKESCTLFEPTLGDEGRLRLKHVQSGRHVRLNNVSVGELAFRLFLTGEGDAFRFVDWDTLVIMPKNVAFKGYNDKYLRSGWIQNHEYLEFSSDDGNRQETAYEVSMNPEGYLLIKSEYFGKYWRRSPNWIWADTTEDNVGKHVDTLFWPVKVGNSNIIALRNAGNNNFCKALTTEGKTNCLNAAVTTISTEARLQVEELVFSRSIYDLDYHLDDARIFNEAPVIAGSGSATNNSLQESTMSITVSYEDKSSYSFSNSLAISVGVEASFKGGIPLITQQEITISTEVTNSFEWGRVTERTVKAEATYVVAVPPMTTVRINYIATQGTCNVPFSYTQRDQLSSDGSYVTTRNIDGVYTGVNYYNFRFEHA